MKILIGISGGLDSAYAALKLKNEGHEVVGAVLEMHRHTELDSATEVAESIGIPLVTVDCKASFEEHVKKYFVREYSRGRTPNPCVVCNCYVKFKCLYDYAMDNGFDKIATGHYARIERIITENGEKYAFASGVDKSKDQTYMLWRLPQNIISSLVLPLADENKESVRQRARDLGLKVAERKDSQEICFLPDGDYPSYIEEKLGEFPKGNFISEDGAVLGEHKGIIRYTVGQRKGLGISLGSRAFVTSIDPNSNTVTLSDKPVMSDTVEVRDVVYSGIEMPSDEVSVSCLVKLRYAQKPAPATVIFRSDCTATLTLFDPVKSVTSGQSAVFYDGEMIIAGGVIESSAKSEK